MSWTCRARSAIDVLIDAGVSVICLLANYAEQFALTDAERVQLTRLIIDHVVGRVPVIVTTSHFSSRVATGRSQQAQEAGAAMVMLMAPYHATERGTLEFVRTAVDAITIPLMIQERR